MEIKIIENIVDFGNEEIVYFCAGQIVDAIEKDGQFYTIDVSDMNILDTHIFPDQLFSIHESECEEI